MKSFNKNHARLIAIEANLKRKNPQNISMNLFVLNLTLKFVLYNIFEFILKRFFGKFPEKSRVLSMIPLLKLSGILCKKLSQIHK